MRAYITAFAISPKAGHLSNNRINFSKAIVIANKTSGAGILPGAIMGRISIIGISFLKWKERIGRDRESGRRKAIACSDRAPVR